MSSKYNYNTTYSAADIEKYLKGELSSREMHDLENAALEDPFLADALDGMSILLSPPPAAANEKPGNADDTGLSRDLDELHARLNARVATGPARNNIRRPIPRWSMAASIILLLGIGCAIYYTFVTGSRSPVVASSPAVVERAAAPKQETLPPANAAAAESPSPSDRSADISSAPSPARTTLPSLSKRDREENKARLERAMYDARPGRLGGVTVDSLFKNSMARSMNDQPYNSLVFKGTVLDDHDHPLPGAFLTLNGYTNTSTVTDRMGQFSLDLPPQDSIQYLTIAMVGYEQKSLPLNTINVDDMVSHVIHLQPDENSLDEVLVSGYGNKRKETLATAPSDSKEELDSLWQKARPAIGRNAYLQYLDTAQKALALDPSITGTEAVSFEVDKKGTLTSFKIQQSLSPAHDEALIRLVKEGPAWQLLQQKKVRAMVSLHF